MGGGVSRPTAVIRIKAIFGSPYAKGWCEMYDIVRELADRVNEDIWRKGGYTTNFPTLCHLIRETLAGSRESAPWLFGAGEKLAWSATRVLSKDDVWEFVSEYCRRKVQNGGDDFSVEYAKAFFTLEELEEMGIAPEI